MFEGYQRGWGLDFGAVKEHVSNDPDYQHAIGFSEGRTIVDPMRLMNLFLLIKFFLPKIPSGHIVEYGSYRGGSAFFMAALAQRVLPGVKVFALDTFEGMPQTNKDVDAHSEGDFNDVDFTEISTAAADRGLTNLHLVKGLFSDTADAALASAGSVALAHIDCDIYDAVRYSYDVSKRYMVPGGYYVFDDATTSSCIGATEAVEDFVIVRDGLRSEQISPHFVFRHPMTA